MKTLFPKIYPLLLAIPVIVSCGGGETSGSTDEIPDTVVRGPSAVTLIFPEHNTECNEGTNFTETTSDVLFSWSLAENADRYDLHLTNLDSGTELIRNVNSNNLTLTLLRATPYSWKVVSKADGSSKTATSTTANFYNAAAAHTSHAPFPAMAIHPKMSAAVDSGTITLEWKADDIDNDILNHELHFGTESQSMEKLVTTEATTYEVSTSEDTIYYWQVVTSDASGNKSTSIIFQFRTK
ncbi:MAG: hypothetical protein AAFX53_07485 [Bacteroidota bacterium]